MAYKLYMAGTLMPITPSKVTVKINNQNKTMTLINGEEINILKAAGLSDVSFELVLPQVSYPFSNGGAQSAAYYLSLFERLKVSKTPFQFILNRQKPGGGMFHYTNLTVGLETYEITDDAGEGVPPTGLPSLILVDQNGDMRFSSTEETFRLGDNLKNQLEADFTARFGGRFFCTMPDGRYVYQRRGRDYLLEGFSASPEAVMKASLEQGENLLITTFPVVDLYPDPDAVY